jgi:SAM-dependent methyltransferase
VKQKDMFLQTEGDAWYARNQKRVSERTIPDDDPVLRELVELVSARDRSTRLKVLEVGCGDGARLAWLKNNLNADCYGVEPSAQAVAAARAKGIDAHRGTADGLPFDSQSFDVVIFGFCLYLCDRDDLFRIASEADRVLRSPGWLLITDFHDASHTARPYHHREGASSFKMDYRTLFTWHPHYKCMTHKVRHHHDASYTDAADEWVAVSVLRKYATEPTA